ncbi:MAG: hypothetical protein H7240_13090, partial [Glaciimonas sp.]|nr:hypothetical protein [Glaciimonas sp.]
MNGKFCSDCDRSKTEVEQYYKISFAQHIAAKKDRYEKGATAEQIANKRRELDQDIRNVESSVNSKISECGSVTSNYQKDQQEAQNKSQADAQRNANERAQRQADENARLYAAQQQREEEERQRLEAERERRAEEERRRQAQLAANIVLYNDRVSSNNAYTQAKLEEQRRNSTLSDVPKYDSNNAKNTIGGTSTNNLGKQAFGGDGKGYLDGNDEDPPKKSTGRSDSIKYDDDEDETSKKTNSAIAPTASSGCDLTFSAVEAQRLPAVVS